MRIITKKIKVIAMTKEEMDKFLDLMTKARDGHMSHYAEDKLEDGTYLGVNVVDQHEQTPQRPMKNGQRRNTAEDDYYKAGGSKY